MPTPTFRTTTWTIGTLQSYARTVRLILLEKIRFTFLRVSSATMVTPARASYAPTRSFKITLIDTRRRKKKITNWLLCLPPKAVIKRPGKSSFGASLLSTWSVNSHGDLFFTLQLVVRSFTVSFLKHKHGTL